MNQKITYIFAMVELLNAQKETIMAAEEVGNKEVKAKTIEQFSEILTELFRQTSDFCNFKIESHVS